METIKRTTSICPRNESDVDRDRVQNLKRGSRRSEIRQYRRIRKTVVLDVWAKALAHVS